jgi:hypothetical protein
MIKPKMTKATKKKQMTLEDFASAVHQDYLAIRKEMVTKRDLEHFATKVDLRDLATKDDLASMGDRISVAKDELKEQIAGLRYAKEIDELRARVNVLESKVKPIHRAA